MYGLLPLFTYMLRSKEDTTLCIPRTYQLYPPPRATAWDGGPPNRDATGPSWITYPHTIWGWPDAGTQAADLSKWRHLTTFSHPSYGK